MDNTVGGRIKLLRKKLGISQEKLAKKVGIKKSTLSAYETNTNDIPSKILLIISKELKTSTDYLLFGEHIENEEEEYLKFLFNKIEMPIHKVLAINQMKCIVDTEQS